MYYCNFKVNDDGYITYYEREDKHNGNVLFEKMVAASEIITYKEIQVGDLLMERGIIVEVYPEPGHSIFKTEPCVHFYDADRSYMGSAWTRLCDEPYTRILDDEVKRRYLKVLRNETIKRLEYIHEDLEYLNNVE